jgi:NADPH:quinone reductase-like Zn-dependent oxidoreductase
MDRLITRPYHVDVLGDDRSWTVGKNEALWLKAKRTSFVVGPATEAHPGAGEIAIRVRAVAVNPMDRLIQSVGDLITPWIDYPFIPGSDVAGEVVAIGEGVGRFSPGDRVVGYAAGADKGHRTAEGGFQTRVILQAHMVSPIPETLSFEAAAVIPLALSTAASGLFETDCLALAYPTAHAAPAESSLLIWGGSTSVGCNAIQLAVAAGYDVIATASARNFDLLRRLGATQVFDYRSKTVITDIRTALGNRTLAGALAIGPGSAAPCIEIAGRSAGSRFVAMATPPATFDAVPAGRGRLWKLVPTLSRIVFGNISLALRARRRGVRTKFVWGSALLNSDVGPMIYERFLPAALAEGRFVAAPEAQLVGHGLERISEALERQRKGVSARKLVVTL